eukprot:PhM_4_TR18503/c0_g1_i1/m.25446
MLLANYFHETDYGHVLDALYVVSGDCDVGTFEHIKRTSSVSLTRGGKELIISFGWSSDYLMRGDSIISFDKYKMTHCLARQTDRQPVEWTTATPTITMKGVTLPSASVTTAIAAVGGVTAASAVVNPSAMMSAQTLALMASFPCLNPAMKKLSQQTSWTLSPLDHYVGSIGSLPLTLSLGLWNGVLLIGFSATHFAIVCAYWQASIGSTHAQSSCTPTSLLSCPTYLCKERSNQPFLLLLTWIHTRRITCSLR